MNNSGWTASCCAVFLKKFNKSMLQSRSMDSNVSMHIKTSPETFLCHSLDNTSTAAWMYRGTILWQTVIFSYTSHQLHLLSHFDSMRNVLWRQIIHSCYTGCSSLQSVFGTHEIPGTKQKSTRIQFNMGSDKLCLNPWWLHKGSAQKLVLWTASNSSHKDLQGY